MAGSTKNITKVPLEHMDWEQVEDNLRETKDLWWLNEIDLDGKKKTQLEIVLEKGRSFKKDELLVPSKWLTPENYQKYVKRVVDIIQKFKVKNMTLDGDTDQALEELKEELQQINESNVNLDGHRKPHTAYIANRVKLGKKRGESWEKFKQLANDSIGKQQVELPGNGKIYLRRVRKDPEQEILYSHEAFDFDKAENRPEGVDLIKRTAFNKAWSKIYMNLT
jgi:outer membrane protein OmpA-like peptidoglycan-associated protein